MNFADKIAYYGTRLFNVAIGIATYIWLCDMVHVDWQLLLMATRDSMLLHSAASRIV